jgi:hypothetical protein
MSLDSLAFTKVNVKDLREGDTFDVLKGHEICKKYIVKTRVARTDKNKVKKFRRVDTKFLPEHYDSDSFYKNKDAIPGDAQVILTQKLHGTSIRIGNTIAKRNLKLHEKLARKLGVKVQETEFIHVSGSRKVIKDPDDPEQNHYYGTDIWTAEGKKLEGIIPQNFIVYAELVGWDSNGGPIQKNYTYQVPHGTADLYIYRVAHVNGQGRLTDLSWEQVKEFCRDMGLKHVPELWIGRMDELTKVINRKHKEGDPEKLAIERDFIDKRFKDNGYAHALPLDKDGLVDEGVCIRLDGLSPYIIKAKSPVFLQHESKMQDEEAVDLEEVGSQAE